MTILSPSTVKISNVKRVEVRTADVEEEPSFTTKMSSSKTCSPLLVFAGLFFILLCVGLVCSTIYNIKIQDSINDPDDGLENYDFNTRPIIGILTQEYYAGTKPPTPANFSYIPASYIKFVEGGGARVVPILINQNETYYQKIFNSINGILFPGGGVDFDTSGFGKAGKILYALAKAANDKGDYFPLWGTCMGFEFLAYAAAGNLDPQVECDAQNITNKLQFTKDAMKSKLFGQAGKHIIKSLQTQLVAANFHHRCLTNEGVKNYTLDKQFRILSWNFDKSQQLKYVSSFEFLKYPFYGVQFHPEKNIYEWVRKEGLPHTLEGVQTAQYFANFFVQEARRNHHQFDSDEEENSYLIYNFNPVFTGVNGSTFIQSYLFPL